MGKRHKSKDAVSCPHCKADVGKPCVSANGIARHSVHVSRAKLSSRMALNNDVVERPKWKEGKGAVARKQPIYVEWSIHRELKHLSSQAGESMREVVHRALAAEILTMRRRGEDED